MTCVINSKLGSDTTEQYDVLFTQGDPSSIMSHTAATIFFLGKLPCVEEELQLPKDLEA